MDNHQLLLGTLRKKEVSKEIQGVVAAVLDSCVRVPIPLGNETVLRWWDGVVRFLNYVIWG